MKKLITVLTLLALTFCVFAEDFTFCDYEILCDKTGREPSYEEYEYLASNPQCFPCNEDFTLEELLGGSNE